MPTRWSRPRLQQTDINLVLPKDQETAPLQFVPLDEFVVLIYVSNGLVFHLLGDVLEETGPPWRGTQLWDVVCSHLDTLVRGHQETALRDMMVQVIGRCDRCKICRELLDE